MNSTVDFSYKEVCGIESYCSGENPEGQDHQQRVAEVQQRGYKRCDLQLEYTKQIKINHQQCVAEVQQRGCERCDLQLE